VFSTAASGTANRAPTMPAAYDPAATARITATGCSETAWPMRNGCSACDSICCTSSTTPSMMSAATQPFDTRTTTTAMAPVTMAPTTGTNEPTNTRMLIGRASDGTKNTAPIPIPTASTAATRICVRV
jgi:hypothetical protein